MNRKSRAARPGSIKPLTTRERDYVEKLIRDIGGRRTIRAKACWRNAQKLILADSENRLRYWECGLPIPHAWVTINSKVVDVTAEAAARKLKRMGHDPGGETGHEYRGVIVNRRAVLRHMLQTSQWDAVLGQNWWTDGEPPLQRWTV